MVQKKKKQNSAQKKKVVVQSRTNNRRPKLPRNSGGIPRRIAAYLSGIAPDVGDLKVPALESLPIVRHRVFTRVLLSTGVAGIGYLVINPSYLCQDNARLNTTYSVNPLFYTSSSFGYSGATVLFPSNNGGSAVPGVVGQSPTAGAMPTSNVQGNLGGRRRLVALTVRIRYLGTELNRGGEIAFVHNPEQFNLLNTMSVDALFGHRHTERRSVTTTPIVFTHMPRSLTEASFNSVNRWENQLEIGTGYEANADFFGVGGGTIGGDNEATLFGQGVAPRGHTLAVLFKSATSTQAFEVELHGLYEGEFRAYDTTTSQDILVPSQVPSTDATAFSQMSAMISRKHLAITNGEVGHAPTFANALLQAAGSFATRALPKLADRLGGMVLSAI